MKGNTTTRLLEIMLEEKLIDKGRYKTLLARARESFDTHHFFSNIIKKGILSEDAVYRAYSILFKMPIVNLAESTIDSSVISFVPETLCRKYELVPVKLKGNNSLILAVSNPLDSSGPDAVRFITDRRLIIKLAKRSEMLSAIERIFAPENQLENIVDKIITEDVKLEFSTEEGGDVRIKPELLQGPIVKLFNIILSDAVSHRASDIHLEPLEKNTIIRYRIDGELVPMMKLPKYVHNPLVSRVKVLSGLDLAIHFTPQDGKIHTVLNNKKIELRVSTLPTIHGEKTVIRILTDEEIKLPLESLGFRGKTLRKFREMILKPQGIILVTGPTGSGKSTTLYSAINYIKNNRPNINIVTIEDPVEYQLPGINQVQVYTKRNMTFAAALRSILRQDPDVILVGEIRDTRTAEIAVRAALTGHLVLSTLHTNDSVGAITRLKELGIDRSLLTDSLLGILAQRLAKKICTNCKRRAKKEEFAPKYVEIAKKIVPNIRFYTGTGCEMCNFTGHRGRIAIIELLAITNKVKHAITTGDEDKIREAAKQEGMTTLAESGLQLVHEGIIDITSAVSAVGLPQATDEQKKPHPIQNKVSKKEPVEVTIPEELEIISSRKQAPEEETFAPSLHGKRILVCDDDAFMRRMLKGLLEPEGFIVQGAEDGAAALKTIYKSIPDLIVLDLRMPNMDGFEFLRRLRSEIRFISLPVLVLTAKQGEENEIIGFSLGADDFLKKPFRAEIFISRVKALLRRAEITKRQGIKYVS